ncbi:MAG TPA: hypothetical protein VFW23_18320, partial [Tepidisphaeraceae bacterium]|nr:hypothetical protein [Tepidisphaeraceae bacterium]
VIGSNTNDAVALSGNSLTINDTTITLSNVSHITYTDPGGSDTINLSGAIPATLNLASGNSTVTNSDSSPVYIAASTGKTTINATAGTTIIPANSGTGIQQLDFAAINISAGAKVVFANSSSTLGDYSNHANRNVAVIDAGGLNIASGGTLDLGDNDLILNYDPANESATRSLIAGLITTGYGVNKNFSGTGLTSSEANYDATQSAGVRALGWGDNADLGKTSFDGVTLSSPNEMLVKFTYYGDCYLDGTVDTGPDLSLFAKGFHGQGSGWDFGDFNYDGVTNNLDLSLFARGLNSGYRTFGGL